MVTATGKARCATCGKEKSSFKCGGCSQEFCYDHLASHKQELSKQFDEIEVNRDLFRQTLTEQETDPHRHPLIQRIDEWERDSISKIQETANEQRQAALIHLTDLETKLDRFTDQLRQSRQENDYNEIDIQQFQNELTRLREAISKPINLSIKQDSIPLINRISINTTVDSDKSSTREYFLERISNGEQSYSYLVLSRRSNIKWMQNGITVAGGNGCGNALNQLSSPLSIFVDDRSAIYIVDWWNNRIMQWKFHATSGTIIAGGLKSGNQADQLTRPTCIVLDKKRILLSFLIETSTKYDDGK